MYNKLHPKHDQVNEYIVSILNITSFYAQLSFYPASAIFFSPLHDSLKFWSEQLLLSEVPAAYEALRLCAYCTPLFNGLLEMELFHQVNFDLISVCPAQQRQT